MILPQSGGACRVLRGALIAIDVQTLMLALFFHDFTVTNVASGRCHEPTPQ